MDKRQDENVAWTQAETSASPAQDPRLRILGSGSLLCQRPRSRRNGVKNGEE